MGSGFIEIFPEDQFGLSFNPKLKNETGFILRNKTRLIFSLD